jgi:hypothetical protein
MARIWKTVVTLAAMAALAGCAGQEPVWTHPTLPPAPAAQIRAACETRAEETAGPQASLPRPCGGEISAMARDNCQRDADLAYARMASRLRARETALSACLTAAGFVRQ